MQVPPSPMPPVPISRVPLWTAIITAVIIVIHFVYNFAASTGTLPQNSVALINYVLIGAELILIIYLIAKKRYIAFLLLALIALNAYFGFRVVKFTVTKTASEKALEGDITATKNLSPSEGLKVLNQEASRINQLNIQSGKLWNAPSPDFSNMNNEQFQTFLQELLDTYEEKKQVVEAFRSDYESKLWQLNGEVDLKIFGSTRRVKIRGINDDGRLLVDDGVCLELMLDGEIADVS